MAQNRLARAYSAGVGLPKDIIQAAKWHILARQAGEPDLRLDLLVMSLKPPEREKGGTFPKAEGLRDVCSGRALALSRPSPDRRKRNDADGEVGT